MVSILARLGIDLDSGDWIALVAAIVSVLGLWKSAQSVKAAKRSAKAAERTMPIAQSSADSARDSADAARQAIPIAQSSADSARDSADAAKQAIPIARASAEAAVESASQAKRSADIAYLQNRLAGAPVWLIEVAAVDSSKCSILVTMKDGPYSIDVQCFYMSKLTSVEKRGQTTTSILFDTPPTPSGINKGDQISFFIDIPTDVGVLGKLELTVSLRSIESTNVGPEVELPYWYYAETIRWQRVVKQTPKRIR